MSPSGLAPRTPLGWSHIPENIVLIRILGHIKVVFCLRVVPQHRISDIISQTWDIGPPQGTHSYVQELTSLLYNCIPIALVPLDRLLLMGYPRHDGFLPGQVVGGEQRLVQRWWISTKRACCQLSWYFGNYSNIIQIKKLLLSLWIVYLPLFIDPRTWPNSDAVIRYLRAAGQRGLSRWPVVFLAICFEKIIPIFLLVYMNCKFLKIFHLLYLLVIKHQLLPKPQDLVLGFEEVLGWEKVLYNWNIVALNLWFWRQHPVYRWK